MISFGTYRLNSSEAYDLTLFALQNGCYSIDTAQLYNNEIDVGRAIKDSNIDRSSIFLTTKIHPKLLSNDSYLNCVLESLQKLDTYIDLLLLHSYNSDDDWHKLEEVYDIAKDSIKYIGVSNYNLSNLTKLLSTCYYPPYANQIEYSPFNQRDDLVSFCLQNNIKIYAYNIFLKGNKIIDEIQLNNKYQLIIYWLQSKNIIPIFGTTSTDHLLSNLANKQIQSTTDVLNYLNNLKLHKQIIMYPKHN